MCKFLGRLLFVLIFLGSAVKKIQDPTPFSKLLIERYERFQNLAKTHNLDAVANLISKDTLELQANQINTVIGIGLIVVSVGVLFGVPYVSFMITLFILSTIIVIHNPLYFEDREKFLNELHQALLNLAMLGVSLMLFCPGKTASKGEVKEAKPRKEKKKKTEEKSEEGKKKKKDKEGKTEEKGKKKSKREN